MATFTLDVTDREAVAALPMQVIEALGVIDGIVDNAGIMQPFECVLDLDDDVIDRVLEVNLRSQMTMVRAGHRRRGLGRVPGWREHQHLGELGGGGGT